MSQGYSPANQTNLLRHEINAMRASIEVLSHRNAVLIANGHEKDGEIRRLKERIGDLIEELSEVRRLSP